ncbi:unnamed protein product [Didymodactylos carnosus]|uniref:Uncharacterized protein n=1 Tax=Didymodactylos carnosus TaxID=1234261 RepID=A0A815IUA8_9BILA|nr:unnamed protein product [Didymodactylos carnosus]CAF4256054.1 unnamed protein product [Didymodactylos carnosus]
MQIELIILFTNRDRGVDLNLNIEISGDDDLLTIQQKVIELYLPHEIPVDFTSDNYLLQWFSEKHNTFLTLDEGSLVNCKKENFHASFSNSSSVDARKNKLLNKLLLKKAQSMKNVDRGHFSPTKNVTNPSVGTIRAASLTYNDADPTYGQRNRFLSGSLDVKIKLKLVNEIHKPERKCQRLKIVYDCVKEELHQLPDENQQLPHDLNIDLTRAHLLCALQCVDTVCTIGISKMMVDSKYQFGKLE